jgi:hypothetical protein
VTTLTSAPVYDGAAVARLYALFFRVEEFVELSVQQLSSYGSPPPGLNGYVTFFDPGCSLLTLRKVIRGVGIIRSQDWYEYEPFAMLEEQPRYRQLQMEAVKDSFRKTFAEQQALVPPDADIPRARVVVMAMAVHCLASGERLFFDYCVRCQDKDSGGDSVCVGDFDRDGLRVSGRWDDRRDSGIGLASCRKF